MSFPFKSIVIFLVLILVSGCINPQVVQYIDNRGWYFVKTSDTLYSIAWRYGLDYRELAQWNQIAIDGTIYPGQRLLLIKPPSTQGSTPDNETQKQNPRPPEVVLESTDNAPQSASVPPYEGSDPSSWLWPTEGRVISRFSAKRLDRKGIDIGGKLGQPIVAVADGKVVYSGNGLAGYGNLVIIKHSDTFLSAYAYGQQRLVKEGETVEAGMAIAKMGNLKTGTARLHFQIRKNGKPVDPLRFLPER